MGIDRSHKSVLQDEVWDSKKKKNHRNVCLNFWEQVQNWGCTKYIVWDCFQLSDWGLDTKLPLTVLLEWKCKMHHI